MSLQIASPFQQFFDAAGDPLDSGYIYVGTVNLNPETNPITVYYDEALTIPAAQPLRTMNGYVMRNGSPARLYTASVDFSMTVRNKNGALVFAVASAKLSFLAGLDSTLGVIAQIGADTFVKRTITGTANQIVVTNGDGVSGNPTIAAVVASQAEAEAGSDNTKLMTALRAAQETTARIATQVEAETGTDNTKLMTPLRVTQETTARLATQSEAVAGSNNTKLMTPLRVAQAVDALGMTLRLLGTLVTTSGTTQTLSGLTLTGYAALLIFVDGVSNDAAVARHLRLGGQQVSMSNAFGASAFNGQISVLLGSGGAVSLVSPAGSDSTVRFPNVGITTASTSLSFTWDGAGNFDAGKITVYGVKA